MAVVLVAIIAIAAIFAFFVGMGYAYPYFSDEIDGFFGVESNIQPENRVDVINTTPNTDFTKSTFDIEETRALLHQYVNAERTAAGVHSLDYDKDLEAVAQAHSADMAMREYFDHVSPEGVDNIDRFNAAGLDCIVISPDRMRTNGSENLVLGGPYYGQYSEDAVAKGSVEAWMRSVQGHRENMLADYWNSEGFGIAFDSQGDIAYITQTFCSE